MKESLVKVVKDFLGPRLAQGGPILMGFSGGVDSSALLSLVLECRRFFQFDLHIAHFDHAWREESQREAACLKKTVEDLGLDFHSIRSKEKGALGANREERAREERYAFLQKVYKKINAQALILAHQRDDQVETVMKRIFEGAGLLSLGGMTLDSTYKDMLIWRPLLSVPREKLLEWNHVKNVSYLIDSTNRDLHFLRPRMREKLLPEIEKWFGKNIQKNIAALGEEFSCLKNFMEKRLRPFFSKIQEGPLGMFIPIMEFGLEDSWERQEFIRLAFGKKGLTIGRDVLRKADLLLQKGVFDKRIDVERGQLIIDQGNLLWLFNEPVSFPKECMIDMFQSVNTEGWRWELVEGVPSEFSVFSFLQGSMAYVIPNEGKCVFSSYDSLSAKDRKKVSGFFSKKKIPSGIKKLYPFVTENGLFVDACFFLNLDSEINANKKILTINLKKTAN